LTWYAFELAERLIGVAYFWGDGSWPGGLDRGMPYVRNINLLSAYRPSCTVSCLRMADWPFIYRPRNL